MKRPFSDSDSLAYCTSADLDIMTSTFHTLSIPSETFQIGSLVVVTKGLLQNVVGTIQQIRNNGDITLKIQQHLGWKFSTCIVNISVLQLLPGSVSPRERSGVPIRVGIS